MAGPDADTRQDYYAGDVDQDNASEADGASGFVGRQTELVGIDAAFALRRLVTLTGMGGCGKTRLAREWCQRSRARHRIVWTDLSQVSDDRHVADAVLVALGARQQVVGDVLDHVAEQIGDGPLVIVLDNCEHLVDAVARLVGHVLESRPHLRVLTTSREALSVADEVIVGIQPLVAPTRGATLTEVLASDAVRLFIDRADLAGWRRAVDDSDELAAIADVCRRVDGLPLAIELAAARLGVLSAAGIADGLRDRFRLLTSGHRTARDRHRTLQACIDWSYRLLEPDEQRAFELLSLFRGGCTLESAAAVIVPWESESDRIIAAVDLLDRLRAKSLVVTDGTPGGLRFRMLESVAVFAGERLAEQADPDDASRQFLDHMTTLIIHAGVELTGLQRGQWMSVLTAEHDNISAALELTATDAARSPKAATRLWELVGALTFYWSTTGRFREAREWFEEALSHDAPVASQISGRWGAAHVALYGGDFAFGVSAAQAALALAEQAGDTVHVARALNSLATATLFFDRASGLSCSRQAIEAAEIAGDDWCLADALQVAAYALAYGGDVAPAAEMLDRARAIAERLDHPLLLAWDGIGRAFVAAFAGRITDARTILHSARQQTARSADPNLRMNLLVAESWISFLGGDDMSLIDRLEHGRRSCAHEGAGEAAPLLATTEVELLAASGQTDRATMLVESTFDDLVREMPPARSRLSNARALICLQGGDLDAAQTHSTDAVTSADGSTARAVANVLAGLVALRRGDRGSAESLTLTALTELVEAGLISAAIDALEVLAIVQVAKRDPIDAARLAGAASAQRHASGITRTGLQTATRHDIHALAAADDADVRAAWVEGESAPLREVIAHARRSRGAQRRATLGWAAVTPTERRVAELAASGLSNAEIARTLFVTTETVKTHLGHLYSKIGVPNRAALASALHGEQPRPPMT